MTSQIKIDRIETTMNSLQGRLKRIERISRQNRHHQVYANRIYEERLRKHVDNLREEYLRNLKRSKPDEILEQQRKQLLDITVKNIAQERLNQKSLKNANGDLLNRPLSEKKQAPSKSSCGYISHTCRLYPCEPIKEYTSFITKDNDRTVQQQKSSEGDSVDNPSRLNIKNLYKGMQETNKAEHRQLAFTIYNQYHLAHRHEFIKRTVTNLDEQSRLLRERLVEKRFSYIEGYQNDFKKAMQSHLKIAAKFSG